VSAFKAAFYKGTRPGWQGFYSRLVRLIDGGKYSHCEFIFSDGMSASASFLDGGVRFKKIDYTPEHWDILDLPELLEQHAKQWFIDHEGEGYDIIGTLRFLAIFKWLPDCPWKWFCSEAMGAAINLYDPSRLGPNGLYKVLRGGK
jgi:hypothetical protein